jgi:RimJ/RimL family protein N-acetyltransferase
MGFGYWVVSEKHSGAFLGEVGFGQYKRGIDSSFDANPEAGWMLTAAAQGKGYGTEAVQAALQWSDARWPQGETVCIISPANEASLALAAKCAFKEVRSDTYKGKPTLVLHRKANAIVISAQ